VLSITKEIIKEMVGVDLTLKNQKQISGNCSEKAILIP
jgi:hypothetical protein